MTRRSTQGRRLRGRILRRVGPALGVATTAAAIAAAVGSSAAAGPEPQATYAALEAPGGPTGLRLGSPSPTGTTGEPPVPTFPASPPAGAGDWPIASSVRRLELAEPGLSGWIALSSQGGVCVLLYGGTPVEGVAAVYAGCSTAEGRARGAAVEVAEIPGRPGEVIAAGVVPDGVSSVSEVLADGSTATSTVSGNAWVRVGHEAAAPGAELTETKGG